MPVRQATDRWPVREPSGTMLLGRERELETLTSMLREAAAGRGSALLLQGEAGIGKTALLAAARTAAAALDIQVLSCSGTRTEAQLPFGGLHQLLWPVRPAEPVVPDERDDLLRAALGLDGAVAAERHRVALAVLELVAAQAVKAPLLVVADNAHWLDGPTADVLAFISRRVTTEPVAILLASRDEASSPFLAAGLPSHRLGALASEQAGALLSRAAPELAGPARDQLLAAAAGNPLALVELSAASRPAGLLPGRVPVGELLQRSFTACLADLPAPARALVCVAAADARRSLAQLCRVAAIAWDSPVAEADIQPAIDGRLASLDGDRVRLAHPLLGPAVYQSLTVGERQLIHRALAQVIPADARMLIIREAAEPDPDDSDISFLPQLTPQETRIARLAASGLSNRQIGEQLFLSHRTVSSHLYHVFPKLGIATRSQLPDALKVARRDVA